MDTAGGDELIRLDHVSVVEALVDGGCGAAMPDVHRWSKRFTDGLVGV
ncbi:hypothetical protein ACQCSX_01770 [Pseudarthrobacter sp. P1]